MNRQRAAGADLDAQADPAVRGEQWVGGVPLPLGDRLGEAVHEMDRAVGAALQPDPGEGVPQHRESGPCAGFLTVQLQLHLDGRRGAGQPLGEQMGQFAQVVRVARTDAGQAQAVAGVLGGPAVLRIGRPLPLPAEASAGEVVVGGRCGGRLRRQLRPAVYGDGGALLTDHRPIVVAPPHGLEVDDPAVGAALLEVQEPVLAGRGAHPAALVGAVDVGVLLLQDDPLLVGAEEVP